MNLCFGVAGNCADQRFGRLMEITREVSGLGEPVATLSSADGRALFALRQPAGFYPLDGPFQTDSHSRLCMLNGYLWFREHFPLEREACIRQLTNAAEVLSASACLNMGGMDGGVFNFFVYDANQESLFIASDYSGVYPLYYAVSEGCLYFSNHLRPLAKALNKELDPVGVIQRSAFHYTIGKRTLFAGIDRLRPGESLRFRLGEDSVSLFQAERLYASLTAYRDEMEAAEAIYSELATGLQEISRPSGTRGILLSGGYDSRLVAVGMAEHGCALSAVVIGEETNREVKLAVRVAEQLGITVRVNNPEADCQLTREKIDALMCTSETINFTHFSSPAKILLAQGAVSATTGYGGDTLLGGNGYALFGSRYNLKSRFFLSLERSLHLPVRFSADFKDYDIQQINQSILGYLEPYLKRSEPWFAAEWWRRYEGEIFEQTRADVAAETRRFLMSGPESPLQVLERFWRDHQELYTADILTTINASVPLCLPTMHHSFVERCANLAPNLKVDNGVYQKLVRRYLGKIGRAPTGSTPLSGSYPDALLLFSRMLRKLDDQWTTQTQMRTRGKAKRTRYGWTNFERWFREGDFLREAGSFVEPAVFSAEYLEKKLRQWMRWDEKLYSGQELLTLITISQLIK